MCGCYKVKVMCMESTMVYITSSYLSTYLTVHIDQLGPRAIFTKHVQLHKKHCPFLLDQSAGQVLVITSPEWIAGRISRTIDSRRSNTLSKPSAPAASAGAGPNGPDRGPPKARAVLCVAPGQEKPRSRDAPSEPAP